MTRPKRKPLISVEDLQRAKEEQRKSGLQIGLALMRAGAIRELQVTDFLSRHYGVPAMNLKDFEIAPEIIRLVPKHVAEKHLAVPVNRAGASLILAMCDPSNIEAQDDIESLTGLSVEAVVCPEPDIRDALARYYP